MAHVLRNQLYAFWPALLGTCTSVTGPSHQSRDHPIMHPISHGTIPSCTPSVTGPSHHVPIMHQSCSPSCSHHVPIVLPIMFPSCTPSCSHRAPHHVPIMHPIMFPSCTISNIFSFLQHHIREKFKIIITIIASF
jgi:hypothetical protein